MQVGHQHWILFIGIFGLLSACSTTSSNKDSIAQEVTLETSDANKSEAYLNAQALIQIENRFLQSQDITMRNTELLRLADTYMQQENCIATNTILKHTQSSLQTFEQFSYANILKAECALKKFPSISSLVTKQANIQLIQNWLNKANVTDIPRTQVLAENAVDLVLRKKVAQAHLYAQQSDFERAIDTMLSTQDNMVFVTDPTHRNALWSWFSQTKKSNRARLARHFPVLQGYHTLLKMVEDNSIDDSGRQHNIQQWLAYNNTDLAAQYLPAQIQAYLDFKSIDQQKIVVLLPLSGRLSGQGEAVKQGLLSAYYESLTALSTTTNGNLHTTSIEFIDTGSFPTMSDKITAQSLAEFDTVIGPLLKSHVDQLSQLNLSNKRQLLLNQPSTKLHTEADIEILEEPSLQALNQSSIELIDNPTSTQEHKLPEMEEREELSIENLMQSSKQATEFNQISASFALSPEQEATQLVYLMRSQEIKNPVLIRDNTGITDRMMAAFVLAWQQTSVRDNPPRLQQIRYSDNKNMRIGITDSLDVLQSQKRIQQLSNLSSEPVQSVTRNRRDIDAFVVFARPNDVELINPIIETSISLFSDEVLPVFATSYSYNHKQNKNSVRDLRNLVFTDIPWLLPQARQESFSVQVDQLLNQPPSGYLRLFAFGYDSLAIVDNLMQLVIFDHMSINGLSGKLSIDANNRLVRHLASIAISDTELNN